MRTRNGGEKGANWQSFADLGLALMSVMLLISVVLIRKIHRDAELQNKVNRDMVSELSRFTVDLFIALENAEKLERQQEGVGRWVQTVFDETGCLLAFNPETGTLEPRGAVGRTAELYNPGDTDLSSAAEAQLASCRDAFLRLAVCMGPPSPQRAELCTDIGPVRAFREDIEALVLQGNTDRVSYEADHRIHGLRGRALAPFPKSFVGNAELGAERARQALGHLLSLIQREDDDGTDARKPLQAFISRARIESASFGGYQAGDNQAASCEDGAPDCCEPGVHACAAARNLSLKLRWKSESLRKPFSDVQQAVCTEWNKPDSPLRRSVLDGSSQDMAAEIMARAKWVCEPQDEATP